MLAINSGAQPKPTSLYPLRCDRLRSVMPQLGVRTAEGVACQQQRPAWMLGGRALQRRRRVGVDICRRCHYSLVHLRADGRLDECTRLSLCETVSRSAGHLKLSGRTGLGWRLRERHLLLMCSDHRVLLLQRAQHRV